jgi:hypothetical protein
MIQPLFEHRMTFAGFNTRVLELEGDGLPIAMFHGYADSADTLAPVSGAAGASGAAGRGVRSARVWHR